jgi:hypothetical protein
MLFLQGGVSSEEVLRFANYVYDVRIFAMMAETGKPTQNRKVDPPTGRRPWNFISFSAITRLAPAFSRSCWIPANVNCPREAADLAAHVDDGAPQAASERYVHM